jgi:cytochrome P450
LSASALKDLEPHLVEEVNKLNLKFAEKEQSSTTAEDDSDLWGPPMDLSDWFNYLTFDVMGKLVFGRVFDIINNPANRYIPLAIHPSARRTGVMVAMPSLMKIYPYLERVLDPERAKERYAFVEAARSIAMARAQAKADPTQDTLSENGSQQEKKVKDIYGKMLDVRDPETGQGFSAPELLSESMLLIVAGSDTTATALSTLFFYIIRNEHIFDKLVHEIRSTFSSLDSIRSSPELTSCVYLRACLNESLRIIPPVGGTLWREVLSGGLDVSVPVKGTGRNKQVHLPAGVELGVAAYALHHNTAYFDRPYAFEPTRWIASAKGNSSEQVERAKSAFCPFSIGPRGCPGQALAFTEASIAVARILYSFDIKSASPELGGHIGEGNPKLVRENQFGGTRLPWSSNEPWRARKEEFQVWDSFTCVKQGPIVQFRPRKM